MSRTFNVDGVEYKCELEEKPSCWRLTLWRNGERIFKAEIRNVTPLVKLYDMIHYFVNDLSLDRIAEYMLEEYT